MEEKVDKVHIAHREVAVDGDSDGKRLDAALSHGFPEFSRNYLQKLVEEGRVSVNGELCLSKKEKVSAGDLLRVAVPEPKSLETHPEDIPLEILYEDEALLVVYKPKGMVVHPAAGNYEGTLVNAILHHCGSSLSSINGVVRPGIVHRIDKDTSGLLMVAKTDAAHRSLGSQLAKHTITRKYEALVYHNFKEDEGVVDFPIGRDPGNRLRQGVYRGNPEELPAGFRPAVTHYRVLERFGDFTHIEARLETGRTHQIRVHMAAIKHPLLGDNLYGPRGKVLGADSQMLHAAVLGFIHPTTGIYMEFSKERPLEFQKVLEKLQSRQG